MTLVDAMCDRQRHRGPDGGAVVPLGRVCLGSQRLSIVDLTNAGAMPMADQRGRWWICHNGEVYNFRALREELQRLGHVFSSKTDTEVILKAFQEWGEESLERFVGMFAFAVYDRATESLTLARDRFGKKPLYYTTRHGHILIASEMKALMEVGDGFKVNRQRLIEWSLYRNADLGAADTLVEDVFSLPPGHLLRIRHGRMEPPWRYYAVEDHIDRAQYEGYARRPDGTVIAEMGSLMAASVTDRLVSDVPVGTLCSGGLDSSLITALAARQRADLTAFHVEVGHGDLDEAPYAQQVANALGVRLLKYSLTAAAFRDNLARAIYHSDAPLSHPNSVALLLLSEFARRQGTIVLLSGEGADELFGGYMQRYRRYAQLVRLRRLFDRLPARVRKALALAGYACERVPITRISEYDGLLAHATSVIDNFAREDLNARCRDAYWFVPMEWERLVLGAMLADLHDFLAPLLRRLDRMSMAASVECRVPFLDHRLVAAAVSLPLEYRMRGPTDKWIVKAVAARELPRAIVHRKKLGFPLPLSEYLAPLARPELFGDGFCVDVLHMHRRGVLEAVANWRLNIHGFFNLLALEIWGRLFFLREPLDQLRDRMSRLTGETVVSTEMVVS